MKLIPQFIYSRIAHRPVLAKILGNISWLFVDRILRLSIGLLVVVWVARYLQPEQFGQLSFSLAFVGMFISVATLGLNGIVVRDIVRDPDCAQTTLGTAFMLQLIGGIIAVALSVSCIALLRPEDQVAKAMVTIIGFSLIFKSSEVIKYWFESQVESRYTVWVESGVFLFIAAIKIVMILSEAPLMGFVWIVLVEAVLVMIGLFYIYTKQEGMPTSWMIKGQRAKELLGDSWPLVLAGLAFVLYMRIDQIMIGQMIGDESVGNYSAAIRISEVWYFIAIGIIASVFPSIIESKDQSEVIYNKKLQNIYDILVFLALCVAVPVTFFADQLILFLFGSNYNSAGSVLAVHIWSGVFVFLGYASNKRLVIEGLQKVVLYRTALGAFVNIVANLLLIPHYDIVGAAYASLLSYFVALFSVYFSHSARRDALQITKSLRLRFIYSYWLKEKR